MMCFVSPRLFVDMNETSGINAFMLWTELITTRAVAGGMLIQFMPNETYKQAMLLVYIYTI
jgi:redox-regulated HSP33 family molecular chaperone